MLFTYNLAVPFWLCIREHTFETNAGAHAQQLCRAVSEAGCSMLAAAWQSGDQAGVKAAFLPLSDAEGFSALASTGTERQVHHQSAIRQLSSLLHLQTAHVCRYNFAVLRAFWACLLGSF